MKRGCLYIDGKDAYTEYGIYVVNDGWNELIAMPPLKAVPYNEWQEEDGIEADLSEPQLNIHEASLKIAVTTLYDGYVLLNEVLADGAYHEFDCREIGRKYTLRLVSMPSLSHIEDFGSVSIKFADDFPLPDYEYAAPQSSLPTSDDYCIDDKPLTDYGAIVLKGIVAEIMKTPTVKPNLLRNIATKTGAIYDPKNVTYKSKDVKVKILMRAASLSQLWRNYDALLYDLIQPDERTLDIIDVAESYPCYYKSCQVNNFYPTGKIWLEFTLTFAFIRDFRIGDEPLLASEDALWIVTEDDDDFITLKPDKQ